MNANKQDAGGLHMRHTGGGLLCLYLGDEFVREVGVTPGWGFRDRDEVIVAYNNRHNGEQCRAASVEDSAVNAVLATLRRERDAWLSWNEEHPDQAAVTTPDVLEMAANLIRALSRGVPEGMALVPMVPTRDMVSAALPHLTGIKDSKVRPVGQFYSGMSAAESEDANWAWHGAERFTRAYVAAIAAQRKEGV